MYCIHPLLPPNVVEEPQDLVKHRRIHSGDKPYSCDLCPFAFAHMSALNKHRRKQHNSETSDATKMTVRLLSHVFRSHIPA
jgi:hypothetical protein